MGKSRWRLWNLWNWIDLDNVGSLTFSLPEEWQSHRPIEVGPAWWCCFALHALMQLKLYAGATYHEVWFLRHTDEWVSTRDLIKWNMQKFIYNSSVYKQFQLPFLLQIMNEYIHTYPYMLYFSLSLYIYIYVYIYTHNRLFFPWPFPPTKKSLCVDDLKSWWTSGTVAHRRVGTFQCSRCWCPDAIGALTSSKSSFLVRSSLGKIDAENKRLSWISSPWTFYLPPLNWKH